MHQAAHHFLVVLIPLLFQISPFLQNKQLHGTNNGHKPYLNEVDFKKTFTDTNTCIIRLYFWHCVLQINIQHLFKTNTACTFVLLIHLDAFLDLTIVLGIFSLQDGLANHNPQAKYGPLPNFLWPM